MTESEQVEQQYAENGANGDSESMDQGNADGNPGREDDRKLFIGKSASLLNSKCT